MTHNALARMVHGHTGYLGGVIDVVGTPRFYRQGLRFRHRQRNVI